MARRSTSTSAFGVSKREGHDATGFYRRFTPARAVVGRRGPSRQGAGQADPWATPARMGEVADSSVALVVTSPPYFAGKEYEEALGEGGVPATYLEYLDLLRDVFAECVRKLEPGGRIAVNVANLGRSPYRSLSADVIGILQDDLRLLLRGRDHLAEAARVVGVVRVGQLPAARQPGAAGPHRAGDRRQQGPVRPGRRRRDRAGGTALRGVDDPGGLHGQHARRVGDPAGERHPRRTPRALPGRAARRG